MNKKHDRDLAAARQQKVLQLIRAERIARVEDLSMELNVSAATIRRDLVELEARGQIRRVHGGAVAVEGRLEEPPIFDDKTAVAADEKKAIAAEALKFIQPDDTIYVDGGTTTLELIRLIRTMPRLTVVTNSLRAAIELGGSGPRLILIGGELRRQSQTLVGPLTRSILSELHVDKAFMGTMGLTIEEGMTTTDPAEAFTKETVMRQAREVILLVHSEKIGKVSFSRSGKIKQITRIITDSRVDESFVKQIQKLNIDLTKAS
jgi:DeoR family fructose operon transcriptional repressor